MGSNYRGGFTEGRGGILVPKSYTHGFEAAKYSRHRRHMPTVAVDSSKIVTPWVRSTLMSHGRYLYANNGLVRAAIDDTAIYTVGDGIIPQWRTRDPGINRLYEQAYLEFMKISDYGLDFSFTEQLIMCSIGMDVDGDHFFILTEDENGFPKLQLIRGHRVGNSRRDPQGTQDGVIRDRAGRIIAYRILENEGETHRDVAANNVVKMAGLRLPDMVRGVSAIAHGINSQFDAEEAMAFEMTGIKNAAAVALVIKTPTGDAEQEAWDEELNEGKAPEDLTLEEMQAGTIVRLGPGEELQGFASTRGSTAFTGFMEFRHRAFAVGYGLPLEFIWKSDVGGTAQRFLLKKAQRRFNFRRKVLFEPRALNRIAGWFVAKQIKRKSLPYHPEWWKMIWQATSPDLTVDVGREAQQNREDILLGSRSLSEDVAERGGDWLELRDQVELEAEDLIERAKGLAERHEISFDLALSLLSRRTPNGNLPAPVVDKPEQSK